MIWIKVYNTQGEVLLAACDDGLLGKSFEEGELQLTVSESFYGGERVSKEIFIDRLKNATIANIVGEAVVAIAKELGMVHEDGFIEIGGVPHAQIAKMI
ncbi:MAG: DUF424 family protein [Thermoplasmata archaeon]|nr:MAG: DUF424 family protein [Thermoplasmata archaeon]